MFRSALVSSSRVQVPPLPRHEWRALFSGSSALLFGSRGNKCTALSSRLVDPFLPTHSRNEAKQLFHIVYYTIG